MLARICALPVASLRRGDAGLVWRRYGHAMPGQVAQAGER
jgi:hypothetical protein